MIITCSKCKKKYTVDERTMPCKGQMAKCNACGYRFEIGVPFNQLIVCPKCGSNNQPKTQECIKCGIVFDKYNDRAKFQEEKLDVQDKRSVGNDKNSQQWRSAWLVFASIYLLIVLIDSFLVFPNERNRPYRDKYFAAVDMIQSFPFIEQVEDIKQNIESMIDHRIPTSQIYHEFEYSCRLVHPWVNIKKFNGVVKAQFPDDTIIRFDGRHLTVHIIRESMMYDKLFKTFPSIINLHLKHRKLNYREKTFYLYQDHNYLDFSIIDKKCEDIERWLISRFALFFFFVWLFPVAIVYIIGLLFEWYRQPLYEERPMKNVQSCSSSRESMLSTGEYIESFEE